MDDGGSEHEDEIRARIKKLVEEQQKLQEMIDAAEALIKEQKKEDPKA